MATTIADMDIDALTHCASFLTPRDISNMAMSSKHLNRVASSDSVWRSLYRKEWPHVLSPQACSSFREAYLNRHTALRQFKYVDPILSDMHVAGRPPHQLLFDKNTILFAQGSSVHSLQTDALIGGGVSCTPRLRAIHNAKVNCMRLFSPSEAYLHQRESERYDNILITSSSDRFVRLWSKGGNRCFKGHTGPVLTLSDKLLGHESGKVFASGSEDGTVRLWSIYSFGKRGQHALKATLYGHEKAVSLLSVSGHKTSLLVSISKNGKVRVWDTTTASNSFRTSCCVGMTYLPSSPVDMKCNDSLVYVAAGSSVAAFDLRTMQQTFVVVQQEKVHSLELLPSRSILCTGGSSRAKLWDIRRVSNSAFIVKPTVELDGHIGPIKHLYMDSYKIVTGGPLDQYAHVWETDTGKRTNSLICSEDLGLGCSAMAVDGCRIVTSGDQDFENGLIRLRDFRTAACPVSSDPPEESSTFSKFWEPNLGSDSQED